MKTAIKSAIKIILGARVVRILNRIRNSFANRRGYASYSQEGEDRILYAILSKIHGAWHINDGFYVDVGAHHPYRYSNTCLFYKLGWRGINIDAMPKSMIAFNRYRRRDINIECGIGPCGGALRFFIFNEPALNTFDEDLAKRRCNKDWYVKYVVDVPILPLSEVLEKNVPQGTRIDFLSIDVEGFDLEVLRSNNWHKFRPLVVAVETLGLVLQNLQSNEIVNYMNSVGYVLYSKTVNTSIFIDCALVGRLKS